MRVSGAVIGSAFLALIIAAWMSLKLQVDPLAAANGHPSHALAKEPETSGEERLFLSRAQLDEARANGILDRPVKSLLIVPRVLRFGDYLWNDRDVPPGPTWIRVDLRSQVMSIFRSGHEIGTAIIVYGGDNKETPTGTLHILGKARAHRSSLYDAEMPYTMRLTDDGVSIHGSSVRWGAATHGCIGVPLPFARRLFEAASLGDEVVISPSDQKQRLPQRSPQRVTGGQG